MQNQEVYDKVMAAFAAKFGGKPAAVAYAPGRIEVLGNHTDYNEGFVFSAAIDKGTFFAASPADDDTVTLVALDINGGETYSCKLADVKKVETGSTWANYPLGTFNWLFDGEPAKAGKGFKAVFGGNIPLGAGLSSSAALEMSTVLALAKIYGIEKDKTTLAKIGQKAEHTFAGCPCGLLDQASSLYGKEGALVKSDFRGRAREERLPLLRVRERADGRRRGVHDGEVQREARPRGRRVREPPPGVRGRGEVLRRRAQAPRHPPARRLVRRVGALPRRPPRDHGQARHPPHRGRRARAPGRGAAREGRRGRIRLAHVRLARVEPQLVRELLRGAGHDRGRREGDPREVLGARLSGGGFGGSCCLLVRPEAADKIAAQITQAYKTAYGDEPTCAVIKPSAGAHLVNE